MRKYARLQPGANFHLSVSWQHRFLQANTEIGQNREKIKKIAGDHHSSDTARGMLMKTETRPRTFKKKKMLLLDKPGKFKYRMLKCRTSAAFKVDVTCRRRCCWAQVRIAHSPGSMCLAYINVCTTAQDYVY